MLHQLAGWLWGGVEVLSSIAAISLSIRHIVRNLLVIVMDLRKMRRALSPAASRRRARKRVSKK
jgi:hypothetical protein